MAGEVGILNVGAGDIKLAFDSTDPAECIRAARIVKDMLRRGYALIIEVPGPQGERMYQRVLDFKEGTYEYIIADLDPLVAAEADHAQDQEHAAEDYAEAKAEERHPPHTQKRGRGRKTVSATTTRGTAIAPTAGG